MKLFCMVTIFLLGLLVGNNGADQILRITSYPVNLRNTSDAEATLTCAISTSTILNDTVAWQYGGVDMFSCDFPYAAGTCTQAENYTGYIDSGKKISTLRFVAMENVNVRQWTCSYGVNVSETFDLDVGYSPAIVNFSRSDYISSGDGNVTLFCSAESDVRLFSISQDSTARNLVIINEPDSMSYSVTIPVPCTDNTFTCRVSNKYGSDYKSLPLPTSCAVEIKESLKTPEIMAKEGDDLVMLQLFYTGKPPPQFSWYRSDTNETKDSSKESLLTSYRTQQDTMDSCNQDNMSCMRLRIIKPIPADSGYYVIRVNESTSGLIAAYPYFLNVTVPVSVEVKPFACEEIPPLSFGQGVGVGIGIGLGAVFFTVGAVYGFRKS